MADAPNDYREPKVTAEKKSSSGSIIPWILLALGVLALVAWLLGFFDSTEEVVVDPVTPTVEEPVTVAPTVTPEVTTDAPAVVVPEAAETPAVVVPDATTEAPAAPNATDVDTQVVPITPVDPETPAVD